MTRKTRWMIAGATLAVLAVVIAGAGIVYGGVFNVAADDPHWSVMTRLLETVRTRSVAAHAAGVKAPALAEPKLVQIGAAHYDAMCTSCHLAPGIDDTELRAGLYPTPPNLGRQTAHRTPAETFWIIKHGLKMTGMPAWGRTHDDASIWGMVAFLEQLPRLDAAAYRALVGDGDEHHHEHGDHDDGDGGRDPHQHGSHEHGAAADASANVQLTGEADDHPHQSAPTSKSGHTHAAGAPPHRD